MVEELKYSISPFLRRTSALACPPGRGIHDVSAELHILLTLRRVSDGLSQFRIQPESFEQLPIARVAPRPFENGRVAHPERIENVCFGGAKHRFKESVHIAEKEFDVSGRAIKQCASRECPAEPYERFFSSLPVAGHSLQQCPKTKRSKIGRSGFLKSSNLLLCSFVIAFPQRVLHQGQVSVKRRDTNSTAPQVQRLGIFSDPRQRQTQVPHYMA